MVEARGETTSEEKEEVLQEEDEAEVLQMSVVEEIIRTQVSQVAKGLINKNSMSYNMTKEGKAQISRPAPTRNECNVNGIDIST